MCILNSLLNIYRLSTDGSVVPCIHLYMDCGHDKCRISCTSLTLYPFVNITLYSLCPDRTRSNDVNIVFLSIQFLLSVLNIWLLDNQNKIMCSFVIICVHYTIIFLKCQCEINCVHFGIIV